MVTPQSVCMQAISRKMAPPTSLTVPELAEQKGIINLYRRHRYEDWLAYTPWPKKAGEAAAATSERSSKSVTHAAANLIRLRHHWTFINIKCESCRPIKTGKAGLLKQGPHESTTHCRPRGETSVAES